RNAFEQNVTAAQNADHDEPVQFGPPEEHRVELFEQPTGEVGRGFHFVGFDESGGLRVIRHAILMATRKSENRRSGPVRPGYLSASDSNVSSQRSSSGPVENFVGRAPPMWLTQIYSLPSHSS